MNTPKVYLYVCDTMADWEVGYLTAELNTGRYFIKGRSPINVVTVGITKSPVTTMGGLKILPDLALDDCRIQRTDVLVLPGGETWTESIHEPILEMAGACLVTGTIVAAICGATFGLANAGLLDSRGHTSNDLDYLKMVCPDYTGENYYKREPAVTDGNLITASGIAPLEFAMHILKALNVCSQQTLDAWYSLNQTKDPKYFFELMNSIA